MKTTIYTLLAVMVAALRVAGQLQVVTTQPDLADVARAVGGDLVKVKSLTDGHEDLHLVRIRPSLLVATRRADVFIQLGLDAEHAWVPPLLRSARNKKIAPGGRGFINASAGIKALRIPTSRNRGQGVDIHPRGNPHFNLDPEGMRMAARNVRDGLVKLLPAQREELHRREAEWEKRLDRRLVKWKRQLAPAKDGWIIEDHDAWIYFATRFGLRVAARLEPKPGLAPTPRHISSVVEIAKEKKCRLVVARGRTEKIAQKVAAKSGAKVVVLPLSSTTGGRLSGYLAFMDHVVESFAGALVESR